MHAIGFRNLGGDRRQHGCRHRAERLHGEQYAYQEGEVGRLPMRAIAIHGDDYCCTDVRMRLAVHDAAPRCDTIVPLMVSPSTVP